MADRTILHLRFDEPAIDIPPSDSAGSLLDMSPGAGDSAPALAAAFAGAGRQFATLTSLQAQDVVPGATLATRDVTVDMLVRWDFDGQNALTPIGTVVTRGIGGSAVEFSAYTIELRVVNFAARIGEIRFVWQDTSGATFAQTGGQFQMPPAFAANGFVMLTATRHWVSPTDVRIQYYAGGTLLSDVVSTTGSIGGGTTGTLRVGRKASTGLGGYFVGVIDELRVRNYHVSQEEIRATWLRLSKWQPGGYSAIRGLMPPRAPISDDPSSRIQRLLRGIGHVAGYAAAQIDNMRQNTMPDQAYGPLLSQWESITREPPRTSDTVAQRRLRVVSHLRQRQGVSVPGVQAAETQLLQVAPANVAVLANTNDVSDDFTAATIDNTKWFITNGVGPGVWSISSGTLRFQSPVGQRHFDGQLASVGFALTAIGGLGRAGHIVATMNFSTLTLNDFNECGVCFVDWNRGHFLFYGLRNRGLGDLELWRESWIGWVSQGAARLGSTFFGGLGSQQLHMSQDDPGANVVNATYRFETAATRAGPYVTQGTVVHPAGFEWAGMYSRAYQMGGNNTCLVTFDDVVVRAGYGRRPFYWTIYRDPALPGTPDINSARATAKRLSQAHTRVGVSQAPKALCDDTLSICDHTPLGGQ